LLIEIWKITQVVNVSVSINPFSSTILLPYAAIIMKDTFLYVTPQCEEPHQTGNIVFEVTPLVQMRFYVGFYSRG